MASIRFERYGIYRADLNPTRGSEISKVRPVVIISLNELNAALETIVVCPLTTTKLHPAWRCRLPSTCHGKRCEIAVDQVRTISKSRLTSRIGTLSTSVARDLRRLISEMYGET
jgi:mRNA interferase MazF